MGQRYGLGNPPRTSVHRPAPAAVKESSPAHGIILRSAPNASVQTVSSSKDTVELRVEHGKANVSVRNPQQNLQILVDLPGGQTALIKDGLYTFNADTNTVSVLIGEARAFPGVGSKSDAKGIKVKEDHQLVFAGSSIHSVDVGPYQARVDLLPGSQGSGNHGDGFRPAYPAYGYGPVYGPYGDGFYGYGYPYYAYGYPYGYGYPFGIGIGFGYGFYGGWGGGFRGRR
jgi:hypothetical protein